MLALESNDRHAIMFQRFDAGETQQSWGDTPLCALELDPFSVAITYMQIKW